MKQLVHTSTTAVASSAAHLPRNLRYLEIKVRLAELVQAGALRHEDARSIFGVLSQDLSKKTGTSEGELGDLIHVQQSEVRKIFIDVLGDKGAQGFIDFTNGLPLTDPLPSQP